MIRFLRSIPRLRQSAAKDMRRHFSMTFSSILSISIALLLGMVMAMLALTTERIATSVEDQLQLQVSLSPVLDDAGKQAVGQQIEQTDGVLDVRYSSRDEELEELIEENGDMFIQYRESNPLYDIYIVELENLDSIEPISDSLRRISGVVEVSYGGESIVRMISVFQSIRTAGWLLCAALVLLCIILIRNTIKMTIMVRQDEISIMRTVGAGNYYIMTPFLLEGLTMGFWGALIPSVIVSALYCTLYYATGGALVSRLFALYPPMPFLLYICAGGFAAGLLLGFFGSLLAAGSTIRRTR